ncbi:MAG: glycosyltransferase family 2 protein [Planctomycetes bacterium]|nr:glycosyltransferase family 2 protein [Planctomycetota bacterium]
MVASMTRFWGALRETRLRRVTYVTPAFLAGAERPSWDDDRPGFEQRVDSSFTCRFWVPPRALLRATVGMAGAKDAEVEFEIAAGAARTRCRVRGDERRPVELSLFEFSEQTVELTFSTRRISGDPRSAIWSEPSIDVSLPFGAWMRHLWSGCRIIGVTRFIGVAARRLLGRRVDVREFARSRMEPANPARPLPKVALVVDAADASTIDADFIGWKEAGDELSAGALEAIAGWLQGHPSADVLYTDEVDVVKPDWSPDHFLAEPYLGRLTLYRRELVRDALGRPDFDKGCFERELMYHAVERAKRIEHLPFGAIRRGRPAGSDAFRASLERHLARLGLAARVEDGLEPGTVRVRHALRSTPLVSIVIPTACQTARMPAGPVNLPANCIRSIRERTTYSNYELVICDNGRLDPEVERLLSDVPHRRHVYTATGPFNLAHKLNVAVRYATGDVWVLLNDDTEVLEKEWLQAMLEYAQFPEVGVVGAKLYYPDGRLQHVGLALNPLNLCVHPYRGHPGTCAGYRGSANGVRNVSGVTGACMMVRREIFDRLGGFDEAVPHMFDLDFCLKARERGLRVVYTPYSRLVHFESVTIGNAGATYLGDHREMRRRWGEILRGRDPYGVPDSAEHGRGCAGVTR